MVDRTFVAGQLERIRAVWPSMASSADALDAYTAVLNGFNPEEVRGAVSLVLQDYEGMAAPKPKHLRDAAGRMAKHLRVQVQPVRDEGYCPRCHTRGLIAVTHGRVVNGVLLERLIPDCQPDCVQRGAWGSPGAIPVTEYQRSVRSTTSTSWQD